MTPATEDTKPNVVVYLPWYLGQRVMRKIEAIFAQNICSRKFVAKIRKLRMECKIIREERHGTQEERGVIDSRMPFVQEMNGKTKRGRCGGKRHAGKVVGATRTRSGKCNTARSKVACGVTECNSGERGQHSQMGTKTRENEGNGRRGSERRSKRAGAKVVRGVGVARERLKAPRLWFGPILTAQQRKEACRGHRADGSGWRQGGREEERRMMGGPANVAKINNLTHSERACSAPSIAKSARVRTGAACNSEHMAGATGNPKRKGRSLA
ncbi:hypothetical protein C8R45DRAFT_944235 [Mycena sanguinolenta]|nr:hypothetical protein C8R45DRAFT_944235 [Mycena sanguinolenta]